MTAPSPGMRARLDDVHARIRRAALVAGRDPAGVLLIAVAKTWPADAVAEAVRSGVTDIGENRAQELSQKSALLGDRVRWHFVGALQTNKVRAVVGTAVLVHSVDRIELADAIAGRARSAGISQEVLIEVNVSGEESKNGVETSAALGFAEEVGRLEGVTVRGLMTIPPLAADPEASRPHFRELARLGAELKGRVAGASELSMGMTGDFEVAIEEGATMIRLGEAVFGPRSAARARPDRSATPRRA